jgi:sugar phosphate isomerase/epimerase
LKKPKLALLTSFCVTGLEDAVRHWPKMLRHVELYAFMQSDADHGLARLAQGLHAERPRNALQILAQLHNIESVADWLVDVFGDRKIVAMSTFLPEIMAHPRHNTAHEAAVEALISLVRLAKALRDRKHPVHTLELVGGSLVNGLWLATGKNQYVINRVEPEAGVDRLLERLGQVGAEAKKLDLRLSLELEPGPLFTIGTLNALRLICHRLDTRPDDDPLRHCLGFNLDIPHWAFLEKIDVAILRREPAILNRIVHAHVSDHSLGHITDSRTRLFHSEIQFSDWLRLIGELSEGMHKKNDGLAFSGYLTCELEAVGDFETIEETVSDLDGMLDRWCR